MEKYGFKAGRASGISIPKDYPDGRCLERRLMA
jgi:hypothetical protein